MASPHQIFIIRYFRHKRASQHDHEQMHDDEEAYMTLVEMVRPPCELASSSRWQGDENLIVINSHTHFIL